WPNESELVELLRSTRDSQAVWDRQQALSAIARQCDQLAGSKDFVKARKVVEEGLGRFPGAPELIERSERLRQQAVVSAAAEAMVCRERHDFGGAIQVLENAAEDWPNESELLDLLRSTRDSQALWD